MLSEAAELYIPRRGRSRPATRTPRRIWTPGIKSSPRRPALRSSAIITRFNGKPGLAAIFNHDRGYGLAISFDSSSLDCFTQWKMMGVKDYVMGLEPGNCYPDGRDVMREKGLCSSWPPARRKTYSVRLTMLGKTRRSSKRSSRNEHLRREIHMKAQLAVQLAWQHHTIVPAFNIPYLPMAKPVAQAIIDEKTVAMLQVARLEWEKFESQSLRLSRRSTFKYYDPKYTPAAPRPCARHRRGSETRGLYAHSGACRQGRLSVRHGRRQPPDP